MLHLWKPYIQFIRTRLCVIGLTPSLQALASLQNVHNIHSSILLEHNPDYTLFTHFLCCLNTHRNTLPYSHHDCIASNFKITLNKVLNAPFHEVSSPTARWHNYKIHEQFKPYPYGIFNNWFTFIEMSITIFMIITWWSHNRPTVNGEKTPPRSHNLSNDR